MGTVAVGEGVRVGAAFDKCRARPVWFYWHKRYYRVKKVCFTWCSDEGSARLHHFSVTDGANTYELKFNTGTLEWTLSKVSAG